jgi:hypothetical protein
MGKLSRQAKQIKVAAPQEIILGTSHIDAQEPRQQPGSLLRTLKLIFLA